ncbi:MULTISPECIES: biotin--[acetyl-CoA-carboxylase] ligase [Clostridium]|uniref:biotin--[acetyl-CoA-carboxylase] ligase n=1 Tax=Clostridium TaxID=1485 RepID=UPI00082569F7|nr:MULTISPECIES: biotin--[acetyl-CoA-carboxylase] ligase [Clostridium]PJI07767.1 biotin--[acetyl-CoA-carboxylase] ligase [Clostridium sp. CT7]
MENAYSPLNIEKIKQNLKTKYIGKNLIFLESIDSTNLEAKRLINKDIENGTLIIAEEQTLGKCRFSDRKWRSPKYKGLWMSLILKPHIEPNLLPLITQLAAASITYSFNTQNDIKAFIKWPNDIILNNKKLVGILTELSLDSFNEPNIILGIGINVSQNFDDFSKEISNKATSLAIELNKPVSREIVLTYFLNDFERFYDNFMHTKDSQNFLKICKKNSILIGKDIEITRKNKTISAKAVDINNSGELVIMFKDGHTENLISGEVTLNKFY